MKDLIYVDNTAELIMVDDKKKEESKKEIRCWCHICEPKQGFFSIDELQEHTRNKHRIFKG